MGHEDGLRQTYIHSRRELDLVFNRVGDSSSFYANIARRRSDGRDVIADIPFDLDSPYKDTHFSENINDKEKIKRMREDDELADEVLGEVWEDAQSLAQKCREEGIPALGVFSGMGVHLHLLFQERVNPVQEKVSTSQWLIEECDLSTHDTQIISDTRRVLRVPNSKRIDEGEFTGVYCIPMTVGEILKNSIQDVLQRSSRQKHIGELQRYKFENRPEMEVHEGYEDVDEEDVGAIDVQKSAGSIPEDVEWIVRNNILPPCIHERFLSNNPENYIRMAGVIHLLNAGFSISEVVNIIQRIGWGDFDREITTSRVKHIYERGYSDPNCSTLMSHQYCVHQPGIDDYSDDPKNCETYGWSNGKAEWQRD